MDRSTAATDEHFLRRALRLARRGRGTVEPNPMVGAVLVRDGRIVGEGWHERYGGPHAEVNALAAAGAEAAGATLYVTLEPCAHFGKTPPCTQGIVQAGVRRVVAAVADPNPVAAGGLTALRAAGLDVEIGLLASAAQRLNAPYFCRVQRGRPFVTAKWAMTLDGRIATVGGQSRWITGPAARRHAHRLRGRMDAILVGMGTVLADDPLLTARPPGPRVATRIVLDSGLRLPARSALVQTARQAPVLVVCDPAVDANRRRELEAAGCECLPLSGGPSNLPALLAELGRRQFTNLLVEGGAEVLGSFLAADLIDAVAVYVAPKIVGGARALGPVGGVGIELLEAAACTGRLRIVSLGADLLLRGIVKHRES